MTIVNKAKTTKLYAGDCVFLSRNHKVKVSARPYNGVELKSVFLTFTRPFLVRYCHRMDKSLLPSPDKKRMPSIVLLEKDLHIQSLFHALSTFFIAWEKPTKQYMEHKVTEGIEALMAINPRFCINLFDFMGPWKINISEFMEQNYTENLSVEEMAHFTGRSVATFKRDFKQISDLTPQRWMTRRRLEEAYKLMSEGKTASEIFLQLGFKSLSHFSTASPDDSVAYVVRRYVKIAVQIIVVGSVPCNVFRQDAVHAKRVLHDIARIGPVYRIYNTFPCLSLSSRRHLTGWPLGCFREG